MKAKIKLNKDFYLVFIFLIFTFLLFIQYSYSKKNIIENFKNQKLTKIMIIKNGFKSIFDRAEFIFKSKLDENIKKLNTLYLMFDNIRDFDVDRVAEILNRNETIGHYEVFVIDRNYTIIKASYKPDLDYNLGQFPVFRKILDNVFDGKEKIDISPIYIDPASMNLKRYFLIRSPDKKYLLQIAYVVDIYPKLRRVYFDFLKKYDDLKKLKLFFVSKYLIYPIHFSKRLLKKTPLKILMKETFTVFKEILKTAGYKKIYKITLNTNEDTAKKIFKIFQQKKVISKLNLEKHEYEMYAIINGFFKNFSNKLIIENIYSTRILENDLATLKIRYLMLLMFVFIVGLFIRGIIYYVSSRLDELVQHMKKNLEIEKKDFVIKEIDELVNTYNYYRKKLNEEIEKNKQLLLQNRQFIIDTVHQIKTPLGIIALNSDFIRMKLNTQDEEIKESLDEIDAAISMLSTAYEDLSYISSKNIVVYKPSKINISEVLENRIKFFINLAKARNKKLTAEIQKDIFYEINKIEIERIIDNNISNAIEYSTGEEIIIVLKKEKDIVLKFISEGKKIKNPDFIFEKNYREHSHKRGLGIGLNIVKKICEKYNAEYKVYYENGKNIFEYRFKI